MTFLTAKTDSYGKKIFFWKHAKYTNPEKNAKCPETP